MKLKRHLRQNKIKCPLAVNKKTRKLSETCKESEIQYEKLKKKTNKFIKKKSIPKPMKKIRQIDLATVMITSDEKTLELLFTLTLYMSRT